MADPGGGPAWQDEFQGAFARMTTPVADVTVGDSTGRPGAPPPATQTSAPSTPGMRATDEPAPEAPESAVMETPTKKPPRSDHHAPAQDERPFRSTEGAQGMQRALGAFRPYALRS